MQPRRIRIGDRWVGEGEPCFVIAEVGVNHNGDLRLAKKLVDAALEAGADAVKFQKRKLSEVYQQSVLDEPRTAEQGLQYIVPLLLEFELSDEDFVDLWTYCEAKSIMALCTPWDHSTADFLDALNVPAFKIGSPDMTNLPLIEHVASKGKPLIISTGMSTEDEIRRTIAFLKSREVETILLHCVSTYPTIADEFNLRFLHTLREWSTGPIGFSSHHVGSSITLAATALGACVVERHITLDRKMRGPDHHASLEPAAFADEVRQIREVEKSLGVPHRWLTRGEVLNRRVLGKSLAAARDISAGCVIESRMLTAKSPGLGISPQRIDQVVGQVALNPVAKDRLLSEGDFIPAGKPEPMRPIDVGVKWGIVARLHDLDGMLEWFAEYPPDLIEFHVSDRDLDAGLAEFGTRKHWQDLVVHAPEYNHDRLIDLCSADPEVRRMSVGRIQRSIDLAREMAPRFAGVGPQGPKVIVHVGGMSQGHKPYDVTQAYDLLAVSVRELRTDGVEFLLENLPPYPWFFGGRWLGHVFVDMETTAQFCSAMNVNICFDTSHAMLECQRSGVSLLSHFQRCRPFVRHLHVSDGAGVSGEGLQIGEGQINFVELWPSLIETGATLVPEIWHGHHQYGKGYQIAMVRLTEIAWAAKALAGARARNDQAALAELIAPASSTVLETLRVIDRNTMGIAFIVDENGLLQAVVTDGDIRRALLRGGSLNRPIVEIANTDFRFAWDDTSEDALKDLLSDRYRVVPVVDQGRRLVGVASFRGQNIHGANF